MALRLRRMGITRIRPLAGGFEAWEARGFPMDRHAVEPPALPSRAPAPPAATEAPVRA